MKKAQVQIEEFAPPFTFTVYGDPQPQGSIRAFMRPEWRHPVLTSDNKKNKPWRQELAQVASLTMSEKGFAILERKIPVAIRAHFFFHKPKSTRKAAIYKTTKPDIDKLARSLMDALTGIVFEDDSQITECSLFKGFGSPSRVEVRIVPMQGDWK